MVRLAGMADGGSRDSAVKLDSRWLITGAGPACELE